MALTSNEEPSKSTSFRLEKITTISVDDHEFITPTQTVLCREDMYVWRRSQTCHEANRLLSEALPEEFYNSVMEIVVYFMESFGSPVHFNYGPRHEMSFGLFLCCLIRIGALTAKDQEGIITVVFVSYIKVIHKLQTTYGLRYARRHGVWQLDDPMYLPYIWGSSQLIDIKLFDNLPDPLLGFSAPGNAEQPPCLGNSNRQNTENP
ncbi:serine/threonine-protein phosphatase 2A activator-like [Schistocerca piceifrons]|uniref:serine/threonine-protein phosphatase 2A activator-like n=1 Tax=Schistocerca piceifrons TaxID=274613 RepID=UPI001F5E6B27|nr:serine/threonine-protein phosphatase 2A activator-like [Schistocerca piceifrons]